jgi:hypothetical protein
MRSIAFAVNTNNAIARIIYASCGATYYYSPISLYAPPQNAAFGIVIKQLFNSILLKHIVSPMVLSYSVFSVASRMKAP